MYSKRFNICTDIQRSHSYRGQYTRACRWRDLQPFNWCRSKEKGSHWINKIQKKSEIPRLFLTKFCSRLVLLTWSKGVREFDVTTKTFATSKWIGNVPFFNPLGAKYVYMLYYGPKELRVHYLSPKSPSVCITTHVNRYLHSYAVDVTTFAFSLDICRKKQTNFLGFNHYRSLGSHKIWLKCFLGPNSLRVIKNMAKWRCFSATRMGGSCAETVQSVITFR